MAAAGVHRRWMRGGLAGAATAFSPPVQPTNSLCRANAAALPQGGGGVGT